MLGKNWFDIFLPLEIREAVRSAFDQLIAGIEIVPHYENEIITKHGERRLILWNNTMLFDSNGTPIGTASIGEDITERRRAEAELRVSEQKFSKAFHSSPDAVTLSEMESGLLIEVNDGFQEVFGFSREEAIGRTALELGLYQNPADRLKMVQALREHGNIRNMELKGRHKSGSELAATLSVELIEINGKPHLITITRDITKRKQAEETLRKSESLYRQAIEVAGAVPYLQSYMSPITDIHYDFIGEGIRQITGYGPEEFDLQLWDSLIQESILLGELRQYSWEEAIRRVRTGEYPVWKCEHRIRARDGSIHWVFEAAVELYDQTGVSQGSIGMLQDITERKQIEASLLYRETIMRGITSAAEFFMKSPDWRLEIASVLEHIGKIINASHAYVLENHQTSGGEEVTSNVFRWTASSVDNDPKDEKFKNIPLHELNMDRWYETLVRGQPFIGDKNMVDVSEKEFLNARGIKALLDMPIFVKGQWWGVMGFDDMTNEREWSGMEVDALTIAANVLGAAIERQIANAAMDKELVYRKKLIEELETKNSELERFTYTVSHDLRSPLVTIKGFLGYLERAARSGNMENFSKDLNRIGTAADKMDFLLKDLLELSRIGRIMNKAEVIPFDQLVRGAVEIVHGQLEKHGITIQIQPDLPAVYGDRQRLMEVVQNLIDNAAKYMGDQSMPQIEIGLQGIDQDRSIFFVKDNGIGIAPEHHEHIFGIFNKLDPNIEGTGVGLAIVKRIIEVHGGRIWVESEGAGKGSKFLFTLPREAP